MLISALHKEIVVKNNFLNCNDEYLKEILEQLQHIFLEIKSKNIESKEKYKELNNGLQILYKIANFIYENFDKLQNLAEILSSNIREIFPLFFNIQSIECLLSLSLVIIVTLKIEQDDELINETILCLNEQITQNQLSSLMSLYLNSIKEYSTFSISLLISLLSNLSFEKLTTNRLIIHLIEFVQKKQPENYNESIIISMFYRKIADVIMTNTNSKRTLQISDMLLKHTMTQQFVKQSLIQKNTKDILTLVLNIHQSTVCSSCTRNSCCESLEETLKIITKQSWNIFGKFTFLNIFIKFYSGEMIRMFIPNINQILLQTSQEFSLSTYACDTYISLILTSTNLTEIKTLIEIFDKDNDGIYTNLECVQKSICDYMIPKLIQKDCNKVVEIISKAIEFGGEMSAVKKLILICFHQLLYINKTKSLNLEERKKIYNVVFNENFVKETSIDRDECVRMQMFSILCKEVIRKNTSREIWFYLFEYLKNNFLGQSNKFRQHLLTNFKPVLEVIVKNIDDLESDSRTFVELFLRYLLKNLYPGVSFQKRSCVLAFMKIILTVVGDKIFAIIPMTEDQFKVTLKTFIYFFTDSFEENRNNASDSFAILVNSKDGFDQIEMLKEIAFEKSHSNNPSDCTIAFSIMRTLLKIDTNKLSAGELSESLVIELERDLSLMLTTMDLVNMSIQKPFYSSLYCLRSLLVENLEKVASHISFDRLVRLCYRTSEVVFPIIASAAPEGCLPCDIEDLHDIETIENNPEYLTVCCWRSCKETSLILGHLSTAIVEKNIDNSNKIHEIAWYFFNQMISVTHKGAFESLSVGFELLCRSLWNSKLACYSSLPMLLLERAMEIVEENEHMCSTRRSAGLPHLFHLLITSQPLVNKKRSSLTTTVDKFDFILSNTDGNCNSDQKRIVHVFNILRLLFKESSLSAQIVNHTFFSIKHSAQFFSSNVWPLRNAATLLFCSIIERIFGPTKSTTSANKYSRLNSKVFFNRYPQMYSLILESLCQNNLGDLGLENSVKIYPFLILLGRLVPEMDDFNDSLYPTNVLRIQTFRYLYSPVWIIRVAAARAVALLSQNEITNLETITYLIDELRSNIKPKLNFLHGAIKTIRFIIEDLLDNSFMCELQAKKLTKVCEHIWEGIYPLVSCIEDSTQCPSEFIDIFELLSEKTPSLLQNIRFPHTLKCPVSSWQVILFTIVVRQSQADSSTIISFIMDSLKSDNYIIRQEILSQTCKNIKLIKEHFISTNLTVFVDLWFRETNQSVEEYWLTFLQLFISKIEVIEKKTMDILIDIIINKLKETQNNKRKEIFSFLVKLFALLLSRYPYESDIEKSRELHRVLLQVLKEGCFYENGTEQREAVASSMSKIIRSSALLGETLTKDVIEVLYVQLNDESIKIRHIAANCFRQIIETERSSLNVLPSFVQSEILKEVFRKEFRRYTKFLEGNKQIGYSSSLLTSGKTSVFETEEINIYYDFVEIYDCVGLNIREGSVKILDYNLRKMVSDPAHFLEEFKSVVLSVV